MKKLTQRCQHKNLFFFGEYIINMPRKYLYAFFEKHLIELIVLMLFCKCKLRIVIFEIRDFFVFGVLPWKPSRCTAREYWPLASALMASSCREISLPQRNVNQSENFVATW